MKKRPTKRSPAQCLRSESNLENELRPELNRARPSGTYGRIRRRDVRRSATAAKWLHRRIVQAVSVLSTIRIGEVRMIEDVEELCPKLETVPLTKMKILGDGEIEVLEAGILEHIP